MMYLITLSKVSLTLDSVETRPLLIMLLTNLKILLFESKLSRLKLSIKTLKILGYLTKQLIQMLRPAAIISVFSSLFMPPVGCSISSANIPRISD